MPVLIDDRVTLADSSVIVQYLEDRYPQPALWPADVADRALARWYEEYADTRIADVLVWGVFRKAVLEPGIFGLKRDLDAIERIVRDDVPGVLDYLEARVPRAGFLFGDAGHRRHFARGVVPQFRLRAAAHRCGTLAVDCRVRRSRAGAAVPDEAAPVRGTADAHARREAA